MPDWQSLPFAIDVSHHNGVVDWPKVAAQRPACVFLKATERQWTDPIFERNRQACEGLGLLWVPYVFLRPDDHDRTIRYFVDLIGDPGVPAALDWEAEGVAAAVVERWIDALKELGAHQPIAYYGLYPPAPPTDQIGRCPRWFPHYPGSVTASPRLPMWPGGAAPDWRKCWLFWQWSDKGAVAGVSGKVDLNRLAVSAERFAAWYRTGDFAPATPEVKPDNLPQNSSVAGDVAAMRAAVRTLQTGLNAEGLLTRRDGSRPGLVDGDPGDQTCKALAAWRDKHPG